MGEYLLRNQEGDIDRFVIGIGDWIDGIQMLLPRAVLRTPEEIPRGANFGPTIATSPSRGTVDHINCFGGQPSDLVLSLAKRGL